MSFTIAKGHGEDDHIITFADGRVKSQQWLCSWCISEDVPYRGLNVINKRN